MIGSRARFGLREWGTCGYQLDSLRQCRGKGLLSSKESPVLLVRDAWRPWRSKVRHGHIGTYPGKAKAE